METFSAILEKFLESFFHKVPKTVILGQNGHFSARLAKLGLNENFLKKRALLFFLPLCPPSLMTSFGKILGAVFEINCVTDKVEIIEPVAFAGLKMGTDHPSSI